MKDKLSTYQALQTEAVFNILNYSDVYFFRKICRWYSEKFHTPLHQVMKGNIVQWDEILLHYYECQMEGIGYNNIYELACQEYIPELVEQFEQDNVDFAKALEDEQAKSIEVNKHKLKKNIQDKINKSVVPSSVKKTEPPATSDKMTPPSMNLNFDDEDL